MTAWSDWVASLPALWAWWRLGEQGPPYASQLPGGPPLIVTAGAAPEPVAGLLPAVSDSDGAQSFQGQEIRTAAAMPALGPVFSCGLLARCEANVSPSVYLLRLNTLILYISGGGANAYFQTGSGIVTPNNPLRGQTAMIVATSDGATARLYSQGVLVGTAAPPVPTSAVLTLGHPTAPNVPYVEDEVFLTQGTVSDDDVAKGWEMAQALPPSAPSASLRKTGLRSLAVSWEPPNGA